MRPLYIYILFLILLLSGVKYLESVIIKDNLKLSYVEISSNSSAYRNTNFNETNEKENALETYTFVSENENYIENTTKLESIEDNYEERKPQKKRHLFTEGEAKIAIIIDDCGYAKRYENDYLKISTNITFAILPGKKRSAAFQKKAYKMGAETIIHVPMEAYGVEDVDYEERTIYTSNSQEEIYAYLSSFFKELPYAKGINNHMGSKATSSSKTMKAIMRFCKLQKLYFYDSKTISSSVAFNEAYEHHIPTAERDVFLDNNDDYKSIKRNFTRLISIAKKHGSATAIGHYTKRNTFAFLQREIAKLDEYGVKLVRLSELLVYENIRN